MIAWLSWIFFLLQYYILSSSSIGKLFVLEGGPFLYEGLIAPRVDLTSEAWS